MFNSTFTFSSVQFSLSVIFDSLRPPGLWQARLSCPLLSPRICLNSCSLNRRCHPTISSSVNPFSSRPQSFPAPGSFPVSRLFASGDQSIGASASVLPVNIQGWFPLGLTGLISLQYKGLSRVFSSTTVWKHQLFSTQPCLWSNSHIHSWLWKYHSFDYMGLANIRSILFIVKFSFHKDFITYEDNLCGNLLCKNSWVCMMIA